MIPSLNRIVALRAVTPTTLPTPHSITTIDDHALFSSDWVNSNYFSWYRKVKQHAVAIHDGWHLYILTRLFRVPIPTRT